MVAAIEDRPETVKLLVQHGADICKKDEVMAMVVREGVLGNIGYCMFVDWLVPSPLSTLTLSMCFCIQNGNSAFDYTSHTNIDCFFLDLKYPEFAQHIVGAAYRGDLQVVCRSSGIVVFMHTTDKRPAVQQRFMFHSWSDS